MSWKKIGANSGYVMVGTVASQLLQWIIMSCIAHWEGPKTLGFYALAQAFALPLQYLSWLSIRQRYLALSDDRSRLADFLFLRATVPALTLVVAFVALTISFGDRDFIVLSGLLFLFKYVEGFYDLIYAIMQKEGNAKRLAGLSIVRTLVSGTVFVILYFLTKNLYFAMLVTAIQQLGLLFFVRGYFDEDASHHDRRPVFDLVTLQRRYHLAVGLLPFGISLVVMSLNTSIPRFLLNGMVGGKELGYFVAVSSFISLGQIATGSLGQSLLQPLAMSVAARDERLFWRQLLWPMVFLHLSSAVGAFLLIFVGSTLLGLIYGPAFKGIDSLLVSGALASGPVYAASIATNGIFVTYLRNALFWSQASTVVFGAVGTIALVPFLHLQGMFVAMGLSGLFQIAVCVIILRRFWVASGRAHLGQGTDPINEEPRALRAGPLIDHAVIRQVGEG